MSGLLITGGDGMLGRAVHTLCPSAIAATRADADLTDLTATRRLFDRVRPTTVLHLAAMVGGVQLNADRGAELFTANLHINTNVLAAAQASGVRRLIGVLSSCAFPIYPDRPSTEEDLHAGMPFVGNLGYAMAKRMLDMHARLLREQYGCQYSTVTPVTMYGPHDNFDRESGHVIGALIRKCYEAKRAATAFHVWGTGQAVRQFIYAPDVAAWLLREVDRDLGPGTTILAPDEGVSIFDLAHLIARIMDYPGEPQFDHQKPEGILVKRLCSRRGVQTDGTPRFTGLEEGIRATVQWFVAREAEAQAGSRGHAGSRRSERWSINV